MSADLWVDSAQVTRGFLRFIGAPARLPRPGVRLMVSAAREGGGVDSWIVERRPGQGAPRYQVARVRNVAVDAALPA